MTSPVFPPGAAQQGAEPSVPDRSPVAGPSVQSGRPLLFFLPEPKPAASMRLFCFPHAGGGPLAFFDWQSRLGPAIECISIQYPGRGQRIRETPKSDIDALVAEVTEGLQAWLDKPFVFYGHSFGAIVAFETARRLRRQGCSELRALYLGAARPPHLPSQHSPLHTLPDAAFAAAVQARYGGIPETILRDSEAMAVFLPPMRADFTAYETYVYRAEKPLALPICVFGGEDDAAADPGILEQWRQHCSDRFEQVILPGGHFFSSASAAAFAEALQYRLTLH
jgi:medium-chain acyl-[acyl-carrier-protein] hydrolase